MKKQSTFLRLCALAVTTMLTMCACAPAADTAQSAAQSPASSGSQSAASGEPSAAPEQKTEPAGEKIVTMAINTAWSNMNPYRASSNYDDAVIVQMFDRLVSLGMGGKLHPRLAERWEQAPDNASLTFYLNPKAKWTDGEPVTADDVVFTTRLLSRKEINTSRRLLLVNLAGTDDSGVELSADSVGVEKIDDHTVKFTYKSPMMDAAFFSEINYFYILPEHLLKDIPLDQFMEDDFWSHPIGNGLFIFDKEIAGERVEFTANRDYYLGDIDFDRFVVRVVPSANMLAGLINGEIDLLAGGSSFGSLPLSDLEMAQKQENLVVDSRNTTDIQYIMINNSKEYFKDVNVRLAVAMAINKQRIVDELLKGQGLIMNTVYGTKNKYYDDTLEPVPYNPEKAKELLAGAGWDSSRKLLLLVPTGNQIREQSATLIQQDLAAVGMTVELQSMDMATEMSICRKGEYDFGLMSAASNGADPTGLINFYTLGGIYNLALITDPQYQELYAQLKGALTEEDRVKYASVLQKTITANAPYVYLYSPNLIMAYNKRMSNMGVEDFSLTTWDVCNWKVG